MAEVPCDEILDSSGSGSGNVGGIVGGTGRYGSAVDQLSAQLGGFLSYVDQRDRSESRQTSACGIAVT
ncbi:MAG: hypothetical protein OXN96_07780 [Bryobacterales bacterium]|nr:hypothetical protein [Bryobacterales bacterium]